MKKNTKKYVPKRHVNVFDKPGQMDKNSNVGTQQVQTKKFGETWVGQNIGNIISAASGAVGLAGNVVDSLNGNRSAINATEANINDADNTTFSGGTTADLMSQWSATNLLDNVSANQLRSDKGALGMLTQGLSGASAGAALGPWGAIGGAVAGIGTGLTSWLGGKARARRRANKLNSQINKANQRLINNFENSVINQQQEMLSNQLINYAAEGGPLETNGIIWPSELMYINKGGSHEENPYEGIQIGVDSKGVPNLVEEGEVIDKANNYVFSDRLKPSKELSKKYKLNKKASYADSIKKISKNIEERPNDKIAKDTFEVIKNDFIMDHEMTRAKKENKRSNKFSGGSTIDRGLSVIPEVVMHDSIKDKWNNSALDYLKSKTKTYPTLERPVLVYPKDPEEKKDLSWLNDLGRTLPTLASAIEGLTLKNDYSNINKFERQVNNMPKVEFTPLGNYVTPKYIDPNILTNKLTLASNVNKLNRTGQASDKYADIANRFNLINSIGDAYTSTSKENWNRYLGTSEFNRSTDQYNSTGSLQAQQANANLYNAKLGHLYNIMNTREAMESQLTGARSQAFNNLMESLSNYAKEKSQLDWINSNEALAYKLKGNKIKYKK